MRTINWHPPAPASKPADCEPSPAAGPIASRKRKPTNEQKSEWNTSAKQQAVRKWMVQAEREANEYRARTSTFQRTLEHDVPMMIAQLNRMIDAIESYSEITPSIMASSPQVVSSADSSPSADSNPGDAVTDASSGLPSPAVEPAIQPQHSESEQKE